MKLARKKLALEIARRIKANQPVASEVAAYLIDTNNASELNSLLRDVAIIRADQEGVVELTATTAFPLSAEQTSEVRELVKKQFKSARQVVIHNQINPDVIGGVSLDMPHANLDLTIRAKLNKLKALTA